MPRQTRKRPLASNRESPTPENIADRYTELLSGLTDKQMRRLIQTLADDYYAQEGLPGHDHVRKLIGELSEPLHRGHQLPHGRTR